MRLIHGFTIGIIALSILVCSCKTIKPERPDISNESIPEIKEQPSSQLNIDMAINLGKYFQKAEQAVPAEHKGGRQECDGLTYSYNFKRQPLTLEGKGKTVTGRIDGKYNLQGSYCPKCV